jgi:hypothetical protein
MWIGVTKWLKITLLAGVISSGWKNCYFISYTCPFWIATFFIPHVGVRKVCIEIFKLPSCALCWYMQNKNKEHQTTRQDTMLNRTSLCSVYRSKHWPTQSGHSWVVGVYGQWCDKKCSECGVTWDCVWHKQLQTDTARHSCKNIWCCLLREVWASRWYVSKWNRKLAIFHMIIMHNYELKIVTGFFNTSKFLHLVSKTCV